MPSPIGQQSLLALQRRIREVMGTDPGSELSEEVLQRALEGLGPPASRTEAEKKKLQAAIQEVLDPLGVELSMGALYALSTYVSPPLQGKGGRKKIGSILAPPLPGSHFSRSGEVGDLFDVGGRGNDGGSSSNEGHSGDGEPDR